MISSPAKPIVQDTLETFAAEIPAIIAEVAGKLRIRIDEGDPAILMVAICHAMNSRHMAQVLDTVRQGQNEVVAGWRVAADDARLLARSTVPDATGEGAKVIARAYEQAAAKFNLDTETAARRLNATLESKYIEMTRIAEASAKRMQMMETAAVAHVYQKARLVPLALGVCALVLLANIYLVVHHGF